MVCLVTQFQSLLLHSIEVCLLPGCAGAGPADGAERQWTIAGSGRMIKRMRSAPPPLSDLPAKAFRQLACFALIFFHETVNWEVAW